VDSLKSFNNNFINNSKDKVLDNIYQFTNADKNYTGNIKIELRKKAKKCRICYNYENDINSPLLSPCKCSGGMKYIHLSCLQTWLKSRCISKTVSSNSLFTSYTLKQSECEVCKDLFPDFIIYKNKRIELLDFMKQENDKEYILLESIQIHLQNYQYRTFYLINVEKILSSEISFGRSYDADVIISDISVSRNHAVVRKKSNYLTIQDTSSKFGTAIFANFKKFKITRDMCLPLQIGKNNFEFQISFSCFDVIRNFRLFGAMKRVSDNGDEYDLSNLNSKNIKLAKIFSTKNQDELDDINQVSNEENSSIDIKNSSMEEKVSILKNESEEVKQQNSLSNLIELINNDLHQEIKQDQNYNHINYISKTD